MTQNSEKSLSLISFVDGKSKQNILLWAAVNDVVGSVAFSLFRLLDPDADVVTEGTVDDRRVEVLRTTRHDDSRF